MRGFGLFLLITLLVAKHGSAQDSDTILTRDTPQFTLLSQISDRSEAGAFLRAYQATDAASRHSLAVSFASVYPRSLLLAQVFDVAAKASIDLELYPRALEEARFSLRLAPENAPLLTLLANVEARQPATYSRALSDAHDALDYLDEFQPPASLDDAAGKRLFAELRASAWFAIGRVHAAQGLTTPPLQGELIQALSALDRAVAWNTADAEIFYLRGVTALALRQTAKAASDLGFAAQSSGAIAPRARQVVRVLFSQRSSGTSTFEQFLSSLPLPQIDTQLRTDRPTKPSAGTRAGYAGPTVCVKCHAAEFQTWQKTGMARMLRPYRPENILGDFAASANVEGVPIQVGIDSRPYFDVPDDSGKLARFHVDFTIGSKWQQAYATALPDGRLQVLPIQYNRLSKAWINYWKIIDPPGSARAVITRFPKLLAESNYQRNCAICHTSRLSAPADGEDAFAHATFQQPGIDCEMCHGPSALHVKRAQANSHGRRNPAEPPVDFAQVDHREGVRICGQCHRQSATREVGGAREMNFSTSTGTFVLAGLSRAYDAFSRGAFYADGRFRETTFIVEAFTRSACYRRGSAQCASCHSPHVPDPEHNLTSLKFADRPNELCLGCHSQFRGQLKKHTHHEADSEASQCVACHMPRIVNALLFKARSHQIEIPRADLTARFGEAESPSACLLCHTTRDAAWLANQLTYRRPEVASERMPIVIPSLP